MAGMTLLLKVSSVKLYEDDGNGTWKDCSENPCVLVISRNPQGLSCSILDKSTRQPCFNRWLTPKVVITHDREDWIGWSEPSKEGLRAYGIKMKPAECVQFVDLISAQLSKASPRSSLTSIASSRADSLNPTPAPHHAENSVLPPSSSSLSSPAAASTTAIRPASQASPPNGEQQTAQTTQSVTGLPQSWSADGPVALRSLVAEENDGASPRGNIAEQNAMTAKIQEQRNRLMNLKRTKEDDIQREKLLMELAKKGAEQVSQTAAEKKPAVVTSKRRSMVDAAAFASQIKMRDSSNDFATLSLDMNQQVWVEHEQEGFLAYRITQRGLSSVVLSPVDLSFASDQPVTLSLKDYEALYRIAQFNPEQTTDISMLGEFVSEPLVLAVLRERHRLKLVFTFLSDMLISVNPFNDVSLYSARVMENYLRLGVENLPPHAFGLAATARRQQLLQRDNQNIVICGEQSSGKTETSKILMKFFGGISESSAVISHKLQCASFIIDSFGNAATHRNLNSSRFSKFISLQVHPDSGQLIGASIETMLLELSRLFSRPVMERNFHVFYYALAPYINDDVQRELSCAHLSDLSAGQMTLLGADLGQVEEASDSKNMATLLSAFKFLKFSNEEISFVFRIVSSCLHLREVKFYEVDQTVKIRSGLESLETACELLGVSLDKMKASIMNKSLRVSAASTVPYSSDLLFCQASLTSLIAALYSSLFDWLLRIINSELAAAPSQPSLSLGILDMAGFEFDKNNGFSQLCINYGSEKIQQLFLRKAIVEELELYQSEGLPEFKVDLVHNDPVVQFYEDKSFGFFSILDAQSHLASGTDDAVLQILFQNLSNASAPSHISHRVYDRSSKSDSAFIIKHHAATVSYNIKGLLAANKEAHLRDDLMDTLRTSSLSILLKMLPTSTSTASAGGPVKVTAKKVGSSVQFRDQLLHLLQRLSSSPCHFIRCFSPNIDGDPESFNGAHVLSQLRSSGIFEAISVRMRGFPFRKSHEQFVSMYQSLAISVSSITPKLMSRKIISNVFGKADGIHVGERTVSAQLIAVTVKLVQLLILAQVFYKHSHHKALEAALKAAVYSQARTIQRHYRSHIARRAVRRLLQVHVACSSILQRLRGLKLDELLRSELKATLQEFGNARVPVLLELEKLILRSEETDPLEKQMLELLQQSDAVASSDVLTARMHELLRRADVLGIDSDVIDKGRRLNAQTVVKMQRRRELAQFAASTDLDELETQVDRAKDEHLQSTPEFAELNRQLIRVRREYCVVLIVEHAMTLGAFSVQNGARNVDVKHLKGALARADAIKSFQPQYQQRISCARMLLDLRECIQIGAWSDAQAILESVMQEGLQNDETTALKLHFASTSKVSDVQSQIKEAVRNPAALESGKLELLVAKAKHSRLSGPDVIKLTELMDRIQVTKGLLEQAIVERKEAQLIQALKEGQELGLSSAMLQEGERVLQRIIERKSKRAMAKNIMSTHAMQAISVPGEAESVQETESSAFAVKMSLIQEESIAALRFALSTASLSVQEKRMSQAVAQHVQARDLEGAVAEQTSLRGSFFQRMGSKFELANLPLLRANISNKPILGWSCEARERSFLVLEHNQLAVRMFNDLLCIMGDKMALYPEMLSSELLSQVSQQTILRDELVVQVCSQLTNNPSSESSGRGWDFLEKVLLNGPVSIDLEAQLDLFIRRNSPSQAKHLFAHYVGQLGLLPEYALRAKRKEDARTKTLFGQKTFFARKSVFR